VGILSIDELIKPDRIHGRLYTDPEIFERELELIFSRHWIFIGHEGEIPNPGDFLQRQIGRQPVIFVRDEQGAVRVLLNRCTHRANAVCHLDHGNAKAFTCQYHGWRFRLSGELAVVPFPDRYDAGFDRGGLGLRTPARTESYRGFVFATLNPDDVSLQLHLGKAVMGELDDIADLSPEGQLLLNAGSHRVRFAGNWKLQVENSIDGYHANVVHRSHFENIRARTGFDPATLVTSAAPARITDLGNGHCAWDSSALLSSGSRTLPSNRPDDGAVAAYNEAMVRRHGPQRTEYLHAKSGTHLFIFPNFVHVGAHLRLIQPVSVAETRVLLLPVMLKGAPQEINTRRLRSHEVFYGPAGAGQADDLEMFERNQVGLNAEVDPWSLISRGMHLEERLPDGRMSGQITDELSNRSVWRRWAEMMSADGRRAAR
jgi:phenylpropionate dioxygenase-like ring-hydroxylating dioxygenase large terminal subunit